MSAYDNACPETVDGAHKWTPYTSEPGEYCQWCETERASADYCPHGMHRNAWHCYQCGVDDMAARG